MTTEVHVSETDQLKLEVSRELCLRQSLPWFQRMDWHLDQFTAEQAVALLDLRAFRLTVESDVYSAADREARQERINDWTYNLSGAFRGPGLSDALPSIVESVNRYQIPRAFLFDTLKAVESSVYGEVIRDWAGMKRYAFRRSASFCMSLAAITGHQSLPARDYFAKLSIGIGILDLMGDSNRWSEMGWTPFPLHWLQEAGYSERQILQGRGLRGYPELIRRLAVQAIDSLGQLALTGDPIPGQPAILDAWVKSALERAHDLYNDPSKLRNWDQESA